MVPERDADTQAWVEKLTVVTWAKLGVLDDPELPFGGGGRTFARLVIGEGRVEVQLCLIGGGAYRTGGVGPLQVHRRDRQHLVLAKDGCRGGKWLGRFHSVL